jgi:ABC-type Fe3+-hydroxamate transport system substrate-binding protein
MNKKRLFSMTTGTFFRAIIISLSLIMVLSLMVGCSSTQSNSSGDTNVTSETKTVSGNTDNLFDLERRTVILNNGIEMPILGLGTFRLTPAQAEESVYHALLDGYFWMVTA